MDNDSQVDASDARRQLEAGIAVLEMQRAMLGDAVVDTMLAAAREKLAALDAVDPQLRQLTLLFMDVVGSTALSQHLDPEETSAVMDDALARATVVVAAHGGRALQYAGDSLLAGFGVDGAREDDAERAVRCGLDLLALGRALGDDVAKRHGRTGFDVRVGIHTGGVLLGGGIDEGSVRGLAVNVAARMEQTAPPGGLRISAETHAAVRGLFAMDEQPPIAIKGVDAPAASWLVVRAMPRGFHAATRGIEGVTTRMIGRGAELDVLKTALLALKDAPTFAAISVVGDAGLGKTRLLDAFVDGMATLDVRPEVFRARASPQTQRQPYGLLRDLVASRFGLVDDDALDVARRKLARGLAPLFAGDDAPAHLLGHLVGIDWSDSPHLKGILDDPSQIRNRAFHVGAALFRHVAGPGGRPVVLLLEDLHWADAESLDFLAHLADADRDVPLLALAFARPTLFERRARWCADAVHRRVSLQPLDVSQSRELTGELLRKIADLPDALRDLVVERAGGNPFFMEELVRMLIDQRAIVTTTGDAWVVDAERLRLTQVPATLTGVLQARLDGLPPAERRTLQHASVIGPVFWDRALYAIDAEGPATLPALAGRTLVAPEDEPDQDLRTYAFGHALLHQVVYGTVLKRDRRDLHARVARWLAARTDARARDFLGAAAEHFEEAGDALAVEYHARAAEHARDRMAHDAVLSHVERGLALIADATAPEVLRLRWRLLAARETTREILGDRPGQGEDVAAMTALADALDDDRLRAFAAYRRSYLARRLGDFPTAADAGREAIDHARAAGDVDLRLRAQRMVATACGFMGDLDGGRALAEETLAEARTRPPDRVIGDCLNTLGIIAEARSETKAYLDLQQQALAAFRAVGDHRSEAIVRSNVGVGWTNLGAIDRARAELEEGLRLIRTNGDRAQECGPLRALSVLALWQGDAPRALALGEGAVDAAESAQSRDWLAIALFHLGNAELACGRPDAARAALRRAVEIATDIDQPARFDAAAGLARVALAEDDVPAALAALASLLDTEPAARAALLENADFPRLVEWTVVETLTAAGDARAGEWLKQAQDALAATAARIDDEALRRSFVENIPHNRAIASAGR